MTQESARDLGIEVESITLQVKGFAISERSTL